MNRLSLEFHKRYLNDIGCPEDIVAVLAPFFQKTNELLLSRSIDPFAHAVLVPELKSLSDAAIPMAKQWLPEEQYEFMIRHLAAWDIKPSA